MHDKARCAFYLVVALAVMWVVTAVAQTDTPKPTVPVADGPAGIERVHINWGEKVQQGGLTMVALFGLSVAMGVFIIERFINLRSRHIAPPALAGQLLPLVANKDYDAVQQTCEQHPSILSHVMTFVVEHRDNPVDTISTAAGDLAGREVRSMYNRTYPLAVIASLAPLLGLLGTMIGMIEAFELVSIYGDDGGATILAGSIAKALITTAVGLIIAIPALISYHFFRHRIDTLTATIEDHTEQLLRHMYLKRAGETS